MIKTILVPARGEDSDVTSYDAALRVARDFRAHIDALHVRMDPVEAAVAMTSDAAGGVLVQGLINQLERDAGERETKAKHAFEHFCARRRLVVINTPQTEQKAASAQLHIETGDEARWIAAYGLAADLIVVSRRTETEAAGRSSLEAALLETGRPLLIPSSDAPLPAKGGTVAIGWKATPQAARAVSAAMPFLTRAKQVIVMTVGEETCDDDAERLLQNLARHGVQARSERLDAAGRDGAETLLSAAARRAQLLVMGGYGHSRLREWVFGGFTQRVLAAAPLPVLMAH